MTGIYKITNLKNGKYYLGSTKNFRKRKLRHLRDLRKGNHHCIHLQRAFLKYGEECFIFELIETCENYKQREQELIDNLDFSKVYNVSGSASGGDLIKNHPDKELILSNHTKTLEDYRQKVRDGVVPKQDISGEKNPNWKGGTTSKRCSCGNSMDYYASTCIKCSDRRGEKNSFYGKTHTEETKKSISDKRKGKYYGNQQKSVLIDDIEFESVSEASRELKIPAPTIVFRCKSKNIKFSNYKYKECVTTIPEGSTSQANGDGNGSLGLPMKT